MTLRKKYDFLLDKILIFAIIKTETVIITIIKKGRSL